MEISAHQGNFISTKINRNMERKNKTRKGEKKKKRNMHTEVRKMNGCLIFLLSIGDKWKFETYFQYNKLFDET